jgi:hypothetical protein
VGRGIQCGVDIEKNVEAFVSQKTEFKEDIDDQNK